MQPGRRPGRARLRRAQRDRLGPRRDARARSAVRARTSSSATCRLAARPAVARKPEAPGQPPSTTPARMLGKPRAARARTGELGRAWTGRAARARRRGLRGAQAGPRRLRDEERLRARPGRGLGRDRLGAGGGDRRRRAGARARQRRGDAIPPLECGHPGGCPCDRDQPRRRADRDPDRARDADLRRSAAPPRPMVPLRGSVRARAPSPRASSRPAARAPSWPPRTSRRGSAAT